jgi:hypothetical protein
MKSNKAKRIMTAVGGIDDSYIAEAAPTDKPAAASCGERRLRTRDGRKRRLLRLAMPVAACLVIAVAVFIGRNHLFTPPVITSDNPPMQTGEQTLDNGAQVSPVPGYSETVQPPSRPQPLLVIADAESMMSASADVMISFTLDLTETQIKDAFPGLELTLGATGYYRPDGSLYWVTAFETQEPTRTDLPVMNRYWNTVTIRVSGPGYGALHSDVVLVGTDYSITNVYGVDVSSFKFKLNDYDAVYYESTFKIGDTEYCVTLCDADEDLGDNRGKAGAVRLTEIVYAIIASGEADFSSIATAEFEGLRQEQFSLERAYADPDFGAFFPRTIPSGYAFSNATRVCNPNQDSLTVHWAAGAYYFQIEAERSAYRTYLSDRIVQPNEIEKYDLSLYPIPWADSIPADLWEVVTNPVFLADELTPDIVNARVYEVNESGEPNGKRVSSEFSVLYGDVLVNVWTKGLTSEQVWNLIEQINK